MHLKTLHRIIGLTFSIGIVSGTTPKGKWDTFNLAPSSKTVYPTAIHSTNGSITTADLLVNNKGAATLSGDGSWVALDFGVEVSFHLPNLSIAGSQAEMHYPMYVGWRSDFAQLRYCRVVIRNRSLIYRVTLVHPPHRIRRLVLPRPEHHIRRCPPHRRTPAHRALDAAGIRTTRRLPIPHARLKRGRACHDLQRLVCYLIYAACG